MITPALLAAAALPNATGGRRERLARITQRFGVLPLLGWARDLVRADLRILAYHRVIDGADDPGFLFDPAAVSASPEAFRAQMLRVRRQYCPMRFDEVLDSVERGRKLPRRALLITFDDGYEDNHRVVYPILKDLGMSAMFFVSTGHIASGLPFSYDWLVHMVCVTQATVIDLPELGLRWELPSSLAGRRDIAASLLDVLKLRDAMLQQAVIDRLGRDWSMPPTASHADCGLMGWDALRQMQAGGMEVGSHGVTHRMLGRLPHAEMVEEVRGSKATLERELGTSVDVISYPVGSPDAYGDAVVDAVRDAGYRMGCNYVTGVAGFSEERRYDMPRLPVERISNAWFEAMVAVPEVFSYPLRRRNG